MRIAAASLLLLSLVVFQSAQASGAGLTAARTLDAAEAAFEAKHWEEAAGLFRELATENPSQGRFWYQLGTAEYNLERFSEANDAYARAAALGHNAGASHYNRGCCLARMGQVEPAVDAIEAAIRAGLRDRENLIRNDADLDGIRDTAAFRSRILPTVPAEASRQDGWRIDFDYLTRRVAETHYDPFRHITRAEWDREIARLSASIGKMEDHDVIVALMQLVARIGDGHTLLGAPADGRFAFHALPLRFYDFNDGLYVRAGSREYAPLVGKRVVRIGRVPAKEALERVATTVQRDNSQQVRWLAPQYLARIEVLDALGIATGLTAVDVTVADQNGHESTATVVPSAFHPHPGRVLPDGWVDMADDSGKEVARWRRDPGNAFTLEYLEGPRIAYAVLRQVLDDDHETLTAFTDRIFALVETRPVEALVLDLRENHGGNNFLARPLARRIETSERVNQRGKLFVITGRETFSACQNLCNWLDTRTEALFVGEPTASRPNFVGEDNNIQLPWSGLFASASSRFWQDSVSEDGRIWIAPDLAAPMSSEDYRLNRDPSLDAILAYLEARSAAR